MHSPPRSSSTVLVRRRHGRTFRGTPGAPRRSIAGVEQCVLQQQSSGEANAEAGGVRRDVPESALAMAGGEIEVDPRNLGRYEAMQEPCGENVIALGVHGALQKIGRR